MSTPTMQGHIAAASEDRDMASRFSELKPAFELQAAIPEANRCLFCFDAPCTTACPTHIDVPRFIKKITTGNLAGSARTILDANILGASCARACPVEVLCEGACVLHRYNKQPIQIAQLQRFSMDTFHASGAPLPFDCGVDTGHSTALIGAGPASLACAAELRRRGIKATIYDERPLPGGLNTYGVAEYKLPLEESLREIAMLSQMGIDFYFNTKVDAPKLVELEQKHDAIFLGLGLGAIRQLGIAGEQRHGVTNALDLIAGYKSGSIRQVPSKVVVIGAGNTAIDAAIASVRLGAAEVHLVYRQGLEQMSAFRFEYEHARREGVMFHWNLQPIRIIGATAVEALALARLIPLEADLMFPASAVEFLLAVDLIVVAIGQSTHADFLTEMENTSPRMQLERGRIVIDRKTGQTSHPKYFAGGDCTNGGREVVDAVADGKRAGVGIASWLETKHVLS